MESKPYRRKKLHHEHLHMLLSAQNASLSYRVQIFRVLNITPHLHSISHRLGLQRYLWVGMTRMIYRQQPLWRLCNNTQWTPLKMTLQVVKYYPAGLTRARVYLVRDPRLCQYPNCRLTRVQLNSVGNLSMVLVVFRL